VTKGKAAIVLNRNLFAFIYLAGVSTAALGVSIYSLVTR
jgi:hypothetical protein